MTRLDFDRDLERLGEALRASTAVDLAREERAAHASRRAQVRAGGTGVLRRPRLLVGGTLGLVGLGAAVVLALGGTAAIAPAYAVTTNSDGSVLVTLNQNSALPQANAKLASIGTHEQITIFMATGAASASGAVTCTSAPGVSGPPVKVLVGTNGTEVIDSGNTGAGTWHLGRCVATSDSGSANSGNTGNG
jgi:hypothetical protein